MWKRSAGRAMELDRFVVIMMHMLSSLVSVSCRDDAQRYFEEVQTINLQHKILGLSKFSFLLSTYNLNPADNSSMLNQYSVPKTKGIVQKPANISCGRHREAYIMYIL